MTDKTNKPFYELPSHIRKPCSQIIQETRLQLKYGHHKVPHHHQTDFEESRNNESVVGGEETANNKETIRGVKSVYTQRPFTPRDTSLWGVSARKRPPSAITLSRLTTPIDDVDELGYSSHPFHHQTSNNRYKSLESRSLSSQSGSLAEITEDDDDNAAMMVVGIGEGDGQTPAFINGMSSSDSRKATWFLGELGGKGDGAKDEVKLMSKLRLNNGHGESDPYQHVNNVEVAVEYLNSLVMEYASEDKPPKSDIISILKKIRALLHANPQINSKLRKKLLELVFKLVEKNQNDENVLFWSSFVLLHCNIIGNNLTTVFKMVFKSSKSRRFRDVVLDAEYLDILMKSLSQICPKTQTESMIYGYGTLKFICSDDSAVLNRVIDLNLVAIMVLHLRVLNGEIELAKNNVAEGVLNGTFQLTSILRSVVGEERALNPVIQSGLLHELCTTLTWASHDLDVLTNVVRILSVVSMEPLCCQIMYNNEAFCPAVVRALRTWYAKDDVTVRLLYCLGNLLANSDDMRIRLFEEPDAFKTVLKAMFHYLDKSAVTPSSIDVLIKATRVIANWIMNPFVGPEICDDPNLLSALHEALIIGESSQELALCVTYALNNTSFYINYSNLDDTSVKIAEYIYKTLNTQDLDVKMERIKVLGNLTRNASVRSLSAEYMGNLLANLDDPKECPTELLYASCGVLINVVVEEKVKAEFLRNKGFERVTGALESTQDPVVALITCQLIWNLVISHENQGLKITQCVTKIQSQRLKEILTQKLEESSENATSPLVSLMDMRECEMDHEEGDSCNLCYLPLQLVKDDFKMVARDLLEKL